MYYGKLRSFLTKDPGPKLVLNLVLGNTLRKKLNENNYTPTALLN